MEEKEKVQQKDKYKKDPTKIGKVSNDVIELFKEYDMSYEDIIRTIDKIKYEINHRSYIRE